MHVVNNSNKKPVIVGLDAVRFVAAVMVVCFHLCSLSWADKWGSLVKIVEGRAAFPELLSTTWFGWVGVEIFFVLSGVVIAYSADGVPALAFLAKRILRLYPAAWVCATVTALTVATLGLETHHRLMREWLASVTLFPLSPWIDPVYWTLGVEMSFYAIVFGVLATRRYNYLEHVAMFIGILSSAYWVIGTVRAPDFLQHHLWDRKLDLSLVLNGCFFALGALIYLVSRKGLSLVRGLAIVLFVCAGLIEIGYRADGVETNAICSKQEVLTPLLVFVSAVIAIIASMMRGVGVGERHARLIRTLELATYPLYLVHQIVGASIMRVALIAGVGKYTALVLAISLCVLGGIGIAVFVEPPIRGALRMLATQVERVASARTSTVRLR